MTSMMPQDTPTQTGATGSSPTGSESGVSDQAKDRVSQVAGEGSHQARKVADDVRHQVREATGRTLTDVRSQADRLRSLSTQADALAEGRTEQAGQLGDVVQKVGRQADELAQRLDADGVRGLVDDVARFGRQRPLTFLGLALGAGFVVGRLVRTTAEVSGSDGTPSRPGTASDLRSQGGNGIGTPTSVGGASAGLYQQEFPEARP
jgi:ElaB/YqjD/DUF883 family membrane-anchored ribosome-binding protein